MKNKEVTMTTWYYVEDKQRKGPVETEDIHDLFIKKTIDKNSLLWKKDFSGWTPVKEISQFDHLHSPAKKVSIFEELKDDLKVIMVKVGVDRKSQETEYGPFSILELRKAFAEKRINDKTYIYTQGMDTWIFLGELTDLYTRITFDAPPPCTIKEKRSHTRRPFVARILYHNEDFLCEGICRDISHGGLQILVADLEVQVGDEITLNVHPENQKHSFTTSAEIVRILPGSRGVSLRFINIGEEALQSITAYIDIDDVG